MKKIMFVLLALSAFAFMSCDSEPYVVGYVTSAKELSNALSNEKYGKDITLKAGDYTFTDNVYVGREVDISVVEGEDANLKFPEGKGLVVTDRLGNGNLSLKGVNIEGTLLIQGGGSNSIYLEDSEVQKVVLDKRVDNSNEQLPRLVVKGDTTIDTLNVVQKATVDIQTEEAPIANTILEAELTLIGDETTLGNIDEESKKNLFCTNWNGTDVDKRWYEEAEKNETEFEIKSASQLAGLAELVNNGTDFTGKTIKLTVDVDLQGKTWTPIGSIIVPDSKEGWNFWRKNENANLDYNKADDSNFNAFSGIFDGGNHTISGLSNEGYSPDFKISEINNQLPFGLFGIVSNAEIRNVKIKNADLTHYDKGVNVAPLVGFSFRDLIVENCHVESSTVKAHEAAAGLVGRAYGYVKEADVFEGDIYIKGCTLAVDVSSKANSGGVLGSTAKYNTLTINSSESKGEIKGLRAGGIIGVMADMSTSTLISDSENNGTIFSDGTPACASGGIVGYMMGAGNTKGIEVEINNCNNKGIVDSTAISGGIVGTFVALPEESSRKVVACKNLGTVGSSDCITSGGIAGSINNYLIYFEDCLNNGTVEASTNKGHFYGSSKDRTDDIGVTPEKNIIE